MKKISNQDLIELIVSRDKKSPYHKDELKRSIQATKEAREAFFNGDTFKPGNLYAMESLIARLSEEDYHLTEEDVALLRDMNIFAVADSDNYSICNNNGKSFVAISDFHGYEYPLDKVTDYYIDEYDCVYILGDACDRGPNGRGAGSISLLLRIKELSKQYPGKVIYVPGNHDQFIVGMAYGDYACRYNLERNGGSDTVRELERLKKRNPKEYQELISWLENLPIQRKHEYDGKTYALAHAFFDEKLYKYNPNYSLRDYFQNRQSRLAHMANNVLWFRLKNNDPYDVEACPTADTVMVIGHTRTNDPNDRSYDLKDKYGRTVTVHCVDGGIAYNGYAMLKYDGGRCANATFKGCHNDTSPDKNDEEVELDEKKAMLHNFFIGDLIAKGKRFFSSNNTSCPAGVTMSDVVEVVESINGVKGFDYNTTNYRERFAMYKKVLIFDYVLGNIITNENDYDTGISAANFLVGGYLFGNIEKPEMKSNINCFTRYRDTRYFAEMLGADNMREVLAAYNCSSVREYLNLKFGKGELDKPKVFGKLKPTV